MKDSFQLTGENARNVPGFTLVCQYLMQLQLTAPEMTTHFANIKVAWTPTKTKTFVIPKPLNPNENTVIQKYLQRPHYCTEMSLQNYIRNFDTAKNPPPPYRDQKPRLVATIYASIFNPVYFWQHTLMSMPFRNTSEIVNPESEDLPESIAYFHNALIINPTFWNDNQKIRNHLEASVHKRYYIDTFLVYLKSLRLKILAYQSGEIIVNDNAEDTEFSIEDLTVVNGSQKKYKSTS
ncbi:uncharacterized protein LOC130649508 [Hydractinia symbiolongicarpus]|uniref:uncharacterized protein LOC130649508 n=1 Tax=Hydractinia symbiolongicarpus TaxID=13093 RepID=UPI002551381B|nr:uncharacterized protein LOC130649508 [Hydractinia symbiolongicarpus]XP_057311787.1 uncharacterized protein LOC130649508 [Hydractinia symbiolongicarpus]